jgi:hypothetical protein
VFASKSSSAWNRQHSALCSLILCHCSKTYYLLAFIFGLLQILCGMDCQLIKLSTASIRIYLSDLKNVYKLEDLSTLNFDDFFITSMIKGAEKLSMNNDIAKRSRLTMLFPVRKLIGHEIATKKWSANI